MKVFILTILLGLPILIFSQPPDVPNIDSLKTDKDFQYYEDKLLTCIEWLRMHPLDQDYELRIRTGNFIRYWTINTPTLTLTVNRKVAAPIFEEENFIYTPDVYMAYYSGMLEYQLLNPEVTDQLIIQSKGIENVLQFYHYNIELLKGSRAIQEYLGLYKSDELQEWIRRRVEL